MVVMALDLFGGFRVLELRLRVWGFTLPTRTVLMVV